MVLKAYSGSGLALSGQTVGSLLILVHLPLKVGKWTEHSSNGFDKIRNLTNSDISILKWVSGCRWISFLNHYFSWKILFFLFSVVLTISKLYLIKINFSIFILLQNYKFRDVTLNYKLQVCIWRLPSPMFIDSYQLSFQHLNLAYSHFIHSPFPIYQLSLLPIAHSANYPSITSFYINLTNVPSVYCPFYQLSF